MPPGSHDRRLGAPLQAEFRQQVGHVVLHRLLGQEHPLADLPVGQAFADQLQHPPLLVGQGRQRIVLPHRALPYPVEHPGGRPRVQQRLSTGDGPDRADQVGPADLLEHVPGGTRHDRVEQRLVVGERGEHQAAQLRHPGPEIPAHRHSVPVRQPHVEHGHIGPDGRHPAERLDRGGGLPDDLHVRLRAEQLHHPTPYHFVIVQQEHTNDRRIHRRHYPTIARTVAAPSAREHGAQSAVHHRR